MFSIIHGDTASSPYGVRPVARVGGDGGGAVLTPCVQSNQTKLIFHRHIMGVCVCVFMKSTRGQMFNNLVGFCFFPFVVAFRVTQTQSPNVPTFAFKVVISHPTR